MLISRLNKSLGERSLSRFRRFTYLHNLFTDVEINKTLNNITPLMAQWVDVEAEKSRTERMTVRGHPP